MNMLKKRTLITTLYIVLGASSLNTFADDLSDPNNQAPLAGEFKSLDKNGDGLLSKAEARKDKLFTVKHFKMADADHDGTLDQKEYSTHKSADQQKSAKLVIADSTITTKAKAKILGTKGLKSLQISVETHEGEVILSGFVDSEAAKARAQEVVAKIEGVKSVKNSLEVKS